MIYYLVRRAQHLLWVLLAVSLLVFLLIYLSGDPATLLAPLDASPEDVARIKQLYGLDQPIWRQYLNFLRDAAQGDLGDSLRYKEPAFGLVLEKLPATIQLALFALSLTIVIGIPLGVWAGARANSVADWVISLLTFVGISIPAFWPW